MSKEFIVTDELLSNAEDILAHFGIKGQKWGVRRFQNPDGTLTEAGKARYAKISSRVENTSKGLGQKQAYSRESKRLASEYRSDADVLQREYDKYMAKGGKWNSRKAERLENKISDLVEGAIWQERSARDDDRAIERWSKVLYKDINKLSDLDHDTTIAVIDSVMDELGDTYVEDLFKVKGKHVKRGSGIEHSDFVVTDDILSAAEDYLAHFGILGMKWGIRRFQNKDGSLTPAGKERYRQKNFSSNEESNSDLRNRMSDPKEREKVLDDIIDQTGWNGENTTKWDLYDAHASEEMLKSYEKLRDISSKLAAINNGRGEGSVKDLRKEHDKIVDHIAGMILDKLGYKNTPEARDMLADEWIVAEKFSNWEKKKQ